MNKGDYIFWTVLAVLLTLLWGLLGWTVYLAAAQSWTVGLLAPWTLLLCLYATGLARKMIREQRKACSE